MKLNFRVLNSKVRCRKYKASSVDFIPHAEGEVLPDVHAGDEISVLTEARRPQAFQDEGPFDRRTYLAQHNIDLVATLRASDLMECTATADVTAATRLARIRRRLRNEIDELFGAGSQVAGVLKAMLIGDRSFVDRAESGNFQKTGVFHVLVVAGLHVGALAFALYWVARKHRLPRIWTMVFTLTLLFSYVAMVKQRPPVLRAAMMAAIVVLGGFFFRRLDLLNSTAVAALLLLVARPLALRDSSFQLTFVAIGCIAGLALPWLEKRVQPYVRPLRGWRDVTRDGAYEPRAAQFRIDLRSMAQWISSRVPQRIVRITEDSLVLQLRYGNRKLLLTGDSEKQAEQEILSENPAEALHADVLKVGHHGSNNSTSPDFLAA